MSSMASGWLIDWFLALFLAACITGVCLICNVWVIRPERIGDLLAWMATDLTGGQWLNGLWRLSHVYTR
jgi:hypothetical protein